MNDRFIIESIIYNNQPGVYYIQCIDNKKIYVGLSDNMLDRFNKHRVQLAAGEHPNTLMQEDYNNGYNFSFKCLHDFKKDKNIYDKQVMELLYMYQLVRKDQFLYNFNDKKVQTKQEQLTYITQKIALKFICGSGVQDHVYNELNII